MYMFQGIKNNTETMVLRARRVCVGSKLANSVSDMEVYIALLLLRSSVLTLIEIRSHGYWCYQFPCQNNHVWLTTFHLLFSGYID